LRSALAAHLPPEAEARPSATFAGKHDPTRGKEADRARKGRLESAVTG